MIVLFQSELDNNNMVFRLLLHHILPYNVVQSMGNKDQEAD